MFNRFLADTNGSVATMFGLGFVMISTATLGAIDYTDAVNARNEAQRALDSTVLSCVTSEAACDPKIFTENMSGRADQFAKDPDVVFSRVGERLDAEANFEIKSLIFSTAAEVFGTNEIAINVTSAATISMPALQDELTIDEIILVLDVSDSMKGGPFDALKIAGEDFLNRVFDAGSPKVTILPYAANVPFPTTGGFERYLTQAAPADWDGCFSLEGYSTFQTGAMAQDNSLVPLNMGTRLNGRGDEVPFCPPAGSEAVFFSSDRNALVSRVQNLEMGFGTATYSALNWAWRAIEDDAGLPFRNGVPSTAKKRAVILISDGMSKIINGYDDASAPGDTHDERAQSMTIAACNILKADPDIELFTSFISSPNKDNQVLAAQNLQDCAPDIENFWLIEDNKIPEAMDEMATRMTSPAAKPTPRLVR